MSMSIGGVGGYGSVNAYDDYRDLYSGRIGAEDAAEMADAVDFDDSLNQAQNPAGVQPVEENRDAVVRIEPAEKSSDTSADHMKRELSHVMDDLMDIQGSLWGFSMRRVIPPADES